LNGGFWGIGKTYAAKGEPAPGRGGGAPGSGCKGEKGGWESFSKIKKRRHQKKGGKGDFGSTGQAGRGEKDPWGKQFERRTRKGRLGDWVRTKIWEKKIEGVARVYNSPPV